MYVCMCMYVYVCMYMYVCMFVCMYVVSAMQRKSGERESIALQAFDPKS